MIARAAPATRSAAACARPLALGVADRIMTRYEPLSQPSQHDSIAA
jgi:hypothetical protein